MKTRCIPDALEEKKPRQKYVDMHPRLRRVAVYQYQLRTPRSQTRETVLVLGYDDYRYIYSQNERTRSSISATRTKVADWQVIGRPQITAALIRERMIGRRVYQGFTQNVGSCT